MGYRNYLSRVTKDKYKELSSLSQKQIFEMYVNDDDDNSGWLNVREITQCIDLHELGKYCEFKVGKNGYRFFKEEMDFEEEEEFYVASKQFFLEIIESYRQNVINYYTNLKDETDKNKEYYIKNKITEWTSLIPYNLDMNEEQIVNSWKFEYAVFELIRIYKTFDWDNDLLIYCGR